MFVWTAETSRMWNKNVNVLCDWHWRYIYIYIYIYIYTLVIIYVHLTTPAVTKYTTTNDTICSEWQTGKTVRWGGLTLVWERSHEHAWRYWEKTRKSQSSRCPDADLHGDTNPNSWSESIEIAKIEFMKSEIKNASVKRDDCVERPKTGVTLVQAKTDTEW